MSSVSMRKKTLMSSSLAQFGLRNWALRMKEVDVLPSREGQIKNAINIGTGVYGG